METTNNETPNNDGSKNNYVNIDAFILAVNTALNNANHPEIEPLLTKRGYNPDSIATAKPMVANLETLHQKQKLEYGEQYEATQTYNKDWDKLNAIYAEHVELARIIFDNDLNNYIQLGLKGKRKQSFSGYMQQAKLFYVNALKDPNVTKKLAQKGIELSELKETQLLIEQVETEKYKQNKETGEAQQATKDRDEAYDSLTEWYSEFKRTAIVALSSKPQLGVILGFK